MGKFGMGFSGGSGSGATPSSSTPQYKLTIGTGEETDTIVVPLATMICTDGTLVILNNSPIFAGYTRTGNTFVFGYTLAEGDTLIFKN